MSASARMTRSSTCTCTPSTPCSTARPGSTTCSPRPRELGMPAHRDDRPRQRVRRLRLLQARPRPPASSRSSASRPTSRPAPTALRPHPGAWDDGGDDDVSGGGAYTHMTLLARDHRGHAQPVPALQPGASLEGYYYKPAHGPRAARRRYAKGLIAHHRLPVGRGPDPAAARPVRRGPAGGRRLPGHLRHGQLLLRADGPRPRHRAPGPRRTCCGSPRTSTSRCVATNDLHYTHARRRRGARGAAVRAVRLDDGRPQPVQVRRRRLLPQDRRRRCAQLWREHARGLRQHPADRRALRRRRSPRAPTCMPRFPVPGGRDRGVLVRQGGRARPARRYPAASPTTCRKQAEYEVGVIMPDGLPRLLPRRRRLHQLGQGQRHPGRPRPRLGRRLDGRLRAADHRPRPARARPDLRAVPQPRARLDARLRHRLRRAPPRRGDPLRHREVRRGPGRADRHLRHDQGQAGGQGLRAGPRLPVRDGRPDHQGDAAGGHGQGHPARAASSTPSTSATARPASSARCYEADPDVQDGRRHRASGSRASSASGACTRPA